jgi:hypothetical protein
VIGTILALTVILGFISMIVLYWVPIAMEDNEASHMRTVMNQFSEMKNNIDTQIAKNDVDTVYTSGIKLGAEGFPMFERETQSQLNLKPFEEETTVIFEDNNEILSESISGSIELFAHNRYYPKQTIIYENGVVILQQKTGSIMKVEPNFLLESGPGGVTISTTMISLHHDSESGIGGIGNVWVSTRLWYVDEWTYDSISGPDKNVTFEIITKYPSVWNDYYANTFQNANLSSGTDYHIDWYTGTGSAEGFYKLVIDIHNVAEFNLSHAYIEAYIGRSAV